MSLTETRPATSQRLHVTAPGREAAERPAPFAHLSDEDIVQIGTELDAIRQEVLDSRGEADAAYIRRVIAVQRGLEAAARGVLLFSRFPAAWIAGTAALTVAKTLENMEIGHNVLHGQWDWMRDKRIHSSTWEWDATSPAKQWQKRHNVEHHTYTNVVGQDNDLGYYILRVDPAQEWKPGHFFQPLVNLVTAMFFEYGIAIYDMEAQEFLDGKKSREEFMADLTATLKKLARQLSKDYLVHPLLSIGSFGPTIAANFTANVLRNLWTHTVIICGHIPAGVETFEATSIEGETKGEWYLRQMAGSANISGGRLMGIMTGHLSHQVEHHLFPDLPSNRYEEVSVKVKELMARYGLRHVSGPLHRQAGSAWAQVFRYSLPNRVEGKTRLQQLSGWVSQRLGGRSRRALLA